MATLARVLITGASGLLGGYLTHTANNREVYGTWNTNMLPGKNYRLDITDPAAIAVLFERLRPEIVIHCAAIGSVDFCERNWQVANNVNVIGTKNIATACQEYKTKMVFISTNAIFNGENPPYTETDKDYPVNRYGRLKLDAEAAVKLLLPDALIVRPIMLYGWPLPGGRSNWATRILDALHERKDINLVNDVSTQPTFAGDTARVIWWLVDHDQTGTFHVGSPTVVTIYECSSYQVAVSFLPDPLREHVCAQETTSFLSSMVLVALCVSCEVFPWYPQTFCALYNFLPFHHQTY